MNINESKKYEKFMEVKNVNDELIINEHARRVKNFKIYRTVLRSITPYVVAGAVVFIGVSGTLGIPFKKDSFKRVGLESIKEMDSLGTNQEYQVDTVYYEDDVDESKGLFEEFTLINKNSNGTCDVRVKAYDVKDTYDEEVISLLRDIDKDVDEVIGKPIFDGVDNNTNVDQKFFSLSNKYRRLTSYDYSTIYQYETDEENKEETKKFLIYLFWLETVILSMKLEMAYKFNNSLDKRLKRIDEENPEKTEELTKELIKLQKELASYFPEDKIKDNYNSYLGFLSRKDKKAFIDEFNKFYNEQIINTEDTKKKIK